MTRPAWLHPGAIIASCPQCCGDLQDEAFSYWCPACQRSWSFTEVAFFDDNDYGDPDD